MRKSVLFCVLLFHTILFTRAFPSKNSEASNLQTVDKSNSSLIRKRQTNDDEDCDIIFPDRNSKRTNPTTKRCRTASYIAKGKGRKCIEGVCADAVDYPYEQMEKIKHKLASYSNLFGNLDGVKILTTKFGEQEPVSLCASMVQPIYPKTLKNDKDIEKFIVNVEGHTQGLLLETCKEKATCMFAPLFPNTYTAKCTQRYGTRRLMALNEDGNPAFDSFVLPSCCVCMVQQNKA